jgi:FtsP/CotA-like multicopper oxidase with cupredoxin domain
MTTHSLPSFIPSFSPISRRRLLAGAGASVTLLALPPLAAAAGATAPKPETAADGFRVLHAQTGEARLRGLNEAATPIWGYDGMSPGPTLRVKQGAPLKVRLVNNLEQDTTIHWHGLRLPNAMDGVPFLTQKPVAPGQSFDYAFTPPDAGSFWYHTHFGSSEQLARGLYGVLIVDEPEPPKVDRDVVMVVDDWRLTENGIIHPSFGNFHDAMMAGRLGQYITLNSQDILNLPVKTNERLRLRIVNTANSRIFQLRLDKHTARVMAVDGQPCPPQVAPNGVLRLAPGTRIDLLLDATLEAGAKTPILVDDLRGGWLEIGNLVYDKGAPVRPAPLPEPQPLPANPLPAKFDLANAFKLDVPLDGGGMAMMMGRLDSMRPGNFQGYGVPPEQRIWALAGVSSTGHDGPPMFTVPRGTTVVLNYINRTRFPHAMHVHGHHFRAFDDSGEGFKPYWLDTVIVDVDRSVRTAFVADNPGKWMLHCHMIEHMAAGMAAWFHVTDVA